MKKMKRIRRIAASILVVVCSIICIRETALFPTEVQAAEEVGYNLKYTLSQPEGDYADALTLNVSSTEDSAQIPVTDLGTRRLMYYALYKPNTAVSESVAVTTVEQESDLYARAEPLLEGFTTYKNSVPEADAGVAYEAYQEFLGIMNGSITEDVSLQYNVMGCSIQLYRTFCAGNIGVYAKMYTAIACMGSYFKTLQDAGCVVENAYGVPGGPFVPSTMTCNAVSESAELTLGLDDDELSADYYLFVWDKTKGSADDLVTPVKSVYHYAIKTTPTLTYSQSTPLVYTGLDLTETLFNQFLSKDKLDNSVAGNYTAKIINTKGEEVSILKDAGTYTVDVTFTPEDTDTYVATHYPALSVTVYKQNQEALHIDSIGTKTYGDEAFTLSTIGGSGDGAVSFTSSNPDIISISGATATIHKAGTVTITATKAEDDKYYQETTTVDLTIGRKALSLGAGDELTLSTNSYTYDGTAKEPDVTIKMDGKTLIQDTDYSVSYAENTNVGTARVTISGLGNYDGTVNTNFAISKANQNTFGINDVIGKKYLDSAFVLTSVGGSGTGTVTYSVPENNGVLILSGDTATIVGAGTVTVTATKAAENNYYSTTTTCEITIAKAAAPTFTFPTAGSITYGQKLSASTLIGGNNQYGTFAWTNGNAVPTVVNSGYEVTFTPSIATLKNYETIVNATDTVAVTVNKATPAVIVNAAISGNSGNRKAELIVTVSGTGDGETPTGSVKFVNGTSGSDVDLEGATAVTITDGKATYTWQGLANQIYKVKAVYSGDDNYNTATSEELSVDTRKQEQQAFNIENIGTKTYGDTNFTLSTTGGSGNGAVTYESFDPTIVSVSGTTATIHKAGTVILKATKAESEAYDEATTSVSLTVGKKVLTVKADDKLNVLAGSAMPQLTYSVNGLVGSDTFTNPVLTTKAVDMNTIGEFEVAISGGTLTNADSYTVTYTNGKMSIVRIGVADAVVSGITDIDYNGSATVQSGLSVKVNGKMLTYGTDYEVTYKNNTAIGTATIVITGKGIYTGSIEKSFQVKVSKGTNYTISNMKYKVTNAKTNGTGTVTLMGSTRSKAVLRGSLKIGDTVKIGGKRFKITVIGDKVFKGYIKLTKVTIGKNVTTIGKEAFYHCKKLKTITINSKQLKIVGKDTIKKIYSKAVCKVPSSKVKAYKKLFKSSTGFTNGMELKKK